MFIRETRKFVQGVPFLEDFDALEPGEKKTEEIGIIGCVLEENGTYYVKIDLLDGL